MECPDTNSLQALIAGRLADGEHRRVLEHAEQCRDCHIVIAHLVGEGQDAPLRAAASVIDITHATVLPVKGTRIGRYEVESLLALGGLSLVYSARDPRLERRVAIKLLKPESSGNPAMERARLTREARAMARVSHANIVSVHDVGEWRGRVFVAMALVEGMNLRAWLDAQPRRVHEIVDVFRSAGRGLAAAHAAGIIHRDFKPDNVLLSAEGRVQVTDFGLASVVEDQPAPVERWRGPAHPEVNLSAELGTRTPAGGRLGTPMFMAPEQHLGESTDGRTDQFAFCVALYEALYRAKPFAGDSYESLRASVLGGKLDPPPRGSRVPNTLRRILTRGLSTKPADRFPTMEALLTALARDRTKVPRRLAMGALLALVVVASIAIVDGIVRDRLLAATRSAFAGTRRQLEQSLALRYEMFGTLANLSTTEIVRREATAVRDQAEFGLGSPDEDAKRLEIVHRTLHDADWDAWGSALRRGGVAVADYKGRLLYSTENPSAFGADLRVLPAIAKAYRPGRAEGGAQFVRRDDPNVLAAGLVSPASGPGLCLVFARPVVLGGVPQAAFVQIIDGRRLLDDLKPAPDLRLTIVTADGSAEGDVPRALVDMARNAGDQLIETTMSDRPWLLQRQSIPGLGSNAPPIGSLLVGRPGDVGIGGLSPHARQILKIVLALGIIGFLGACWRVAANDERRRVRLSARRIS